VRGGERPAGAVLVLCCPADVAMVQATDFGNRDDRAEVRRLDSPSVGCVLVEREVSASPMIVREVCGQDASQMPLAKDDDMLQALASHRANESLREGILPRAVRGREDFLDPHALHSVPKLLAVDLVTVAQEIRRRRVVREAVHDLLGGPEGGGVLGDVEVDDGSAMVSEYDENEENAQARRGHSEEIEGDQVSDVVVEERAPSLRRLGAPLRHEPGDCALGHVDTELQQLAMDSRSAPERVRGGHAGDQSLGLGMDGWATSGRAAGELGPVLAEAAPLPPQDGVGVTIARGCLHPGQTLASQIQKRRSVVRSLGRAVVLLYTASCCRRARFSTASCRWPPKRKGNSRSRWSRRVIIEPGLCLDQDCQINRFCASHGFGEGQPPNWAFSGELTPGGTVQSVTWLGG